ncbi:MAG: methyltransferase domain-containing protein [Caldilineaceae bacterium]|nr:methyltransferase domain-containing protein [Caldilineaceae bacterium]
MPSASPNSIWRTLYGWACQRLYNEFAWQYDRVSWWVSLGHWERWRTCALDEVRGERLLEIGCGTGELLTTLAAERTGERSGERAVERAVERFVIGLELSPAMHAVIAAKLGHCRRDTPRVQASALALPFAADSFDTVLATFPAPYILDPQTLTECGRVLGPAEGRLVITGLWVDLDNRFLRPLAPLFYGRPSAATIERLRQQIAAAGFAVRVRERLVANARVGIVIAEVQHVCDR